MSVVRQNLKEAGFGEPTNPRAKLWPDEQKSHIRSHAWISLPVKMKSDSYTESHGINEAGRWSERNVWYPGRSVR